MAETSQTVLTLEDEIPPEKMETYEEGKKYKEAADKLYLEGNHKEALKKYHFTILHWKGITRQNPTTENSQSESKPKSQLDEGLSKVYSNMSQCHLLDKKYDRTIQTADQALALNGDNYKALFRKAKALGELGFFEKAEPILNDLITKYPAEAPKVKSELSILRAKDEERERKARKKIRGFLNNRKEIFDDETAPKLENVSESAKIEEVPEE